MSKYIDAEKLKAEIERIREINRKAFKAEHVESDIFHGRPQAINHLYCALQNGIYTHILGLITSLQQEQSENLSSLINEATNVAKRIVDRNSFYSSLPQNLRNKYTSEEWCEILKAFSTIKKQERLEEEFEDKFANFLERMDAKLGANSWSEEDLRELAEYFYFNNKQPKMDLEKELNKWRHMHFKGKRDGDYDGEYLERESQLDIARYFWNKGYTAGKEE